MESLKEYLIRFVPTHASQEILLSIKEHSCVLITGPFGSGKTAIAYHIISKLEKEGFEITVASNPEEIVRCFHGKKRHLFLIDDVLGKYSSNISDITHRWEKCGPKINAILTNNGTVKVLITCRTYIYQLNAKCFESLRKHVSFIHKNLISENLRLNLEERIKIYKSYFESEPPELISGEMLSLYHFYPVMCSSYSKENVLQYFKHPDEILFAEISSMQRLSDTGYLALAILVVLNNRIENKVLFGVNSFEKSYNIIFQDIFNESCFNQYPSKDMLQMTFTSLMGDFIKNDETFLSFLCPELFDTVAVCIRGSFMQSILTHSSSVFIKEKLQLSPPHGNNCSHAITVQHNMEDRFFRRLISDMNDNSILDVLSNKLFKSQENRSKFVVCLHKYEISKMLVESATGSNVLHFVSSLGYSDFLTHLLTYGNCPSVNKKNIKRETPLHLACQNGHKQCVECLIKYKSQIDEKDSVNRTALHYACEAEHESIVKYLITNNAAINIRDVTGMTPLNIACDKGYHGVVRCLVEKGANINEADKRGRTPLHYACTHSMYNIVELLIFNKARVNKSDDQGYTPLDIACECGNKEVVILLVHNKAVTKSKSKQGLTPLEIASKKNLENISNYLRQCKSN